MVYYNTGEWVKIENLGELCKALNMFPDTVGCYVEIRFLETIEDDCDGRSKLSIQRKSPEIEAW